MPYKLSGVLKSPNGQPLTGVDIRFIAQQTQSPVLQQTDHNIRLGLDGAYNVTLENNTYAVKAQINGLGPQHMGYILISSETPAGLDLPQLLRSYSQQSTAPDYAQLIEKWLSEAKSAADTSTAQAALAKSQADRAKSEADRASQISGLDTVADAIGLAAVPFPDVWIPFNDSLRMFAGYGREVKVGDDVVARMVNFERNGTATFWDKSGVFRTAAINEPRFEKQGLLLEGQSTNLIGVSNFPQNLGNWSTPNSTGNVYSYIQAPDGTNSALKAAFAGDGLNQSIAGLVVGNAYTFSFYAKNDTATPVVSNIRIGSGAQSVNINIPANTGWTRYQYTQTFNAGDSILRWYFTTKNIDVSLWGTQLEALPFASSYIPTNGTAVTRAADKITINGVNNCPDIRTGVAFAMAFELDVVAPTQSGFFCSTQGVGRFNHFDISANNLRWHRASGNPLSAPITYGKKLLVVISVDAGDLAKLCVDGTMASGVRTPTTGGAVTSLDFQNINGHVRNLRIWHSALSDAQIKGLK